MQLPESLNILGFNYDIVLTDDKNILNLNNELVDGFVNLRELKIYIDSTLNPELQLQTLCHEIVHAIDYRMTKNDENLTENQTDIIGTGLASILMNNEFIVEYREEDDETRI